MKTANRLPPHPPLWAEVFGVDRNGMFAEFTVGPVRFVWRWIPPGRFLMGSPSDERGRWDDEGPQHSVKISEGFWLGETPVTQRQWQALNRENSSIFKGEDLPVEQVDWNQCMAFCVELAASKDMCITLPSEAQWEYASRAGTQGAYHVDGSTCSKPSGKDPVLDGLGWFYENSYATTHPHPVREKTSNAWGLYDMHGNVWEWCRDGMRSYGDALEVDPKGPLEESVRRVVRGGSYFHLARDCRAASRNRFDPGVRRNGLGFRLCAGQVEP